MLGKYKNMHRIYSIINFDMNPMGMILCIGGLN